jgi:Family of unknown function (DUF5343)
MAIVHEGPAPYAPIAHVLRAIEYYREKAPASLSKELLVRLGFPEAYANRTLRALRLFDLIDEDGTPTPAFKELRLAGTDEFQQRLEQVVRTAYAEVFEVVDPASDSDTAIRDAFRYYDPAAQRDKMAVLFMGMCEAAGIIDSERAPRKRLRTRRLPSGRKQIVEPTGTKGAAPGGSDTAQIVEEDPARDRPSVDSAEALRLRYLDLLMKKAEEQDEIDTGLLDRIEALLYPKRPDGGNEE